jgi:hypothetical protein
VPHEITWERQGVTKRFWGAVTGEEFVRSSHEVETSPRFDDLRFIINDFSEITGHSIEEADIEKLAIIRVGSMRTNRNFRVVIVTTDSRLAAIPTAISKGSFVGTYETEAFATIALARQWLQQKPVQTPFCRLPK